MLLYKEQFFLELHEMRQIKVHFIYKKLYIELVALSSQTQFWRWKSLSKIKHPGTSGIQEEL